VEFNGIDGAHVICGFFHIHFAKISEIVFTQEFAGGNFHNWNVQFSASEEISVCTGETSEASVESGRDRMDREDANVVRKTAVDHFNIIEIFSDPQIRTEVVACSMDTFVCPTTPTVIAGILGLNKTGFRERLE
jgi:hypothetical protein